MSTPRIVLVGHICIDHNKSEHATYTNWGSSVVYMAQSFAKQFGATPVIATNYGSDILPYLPAVTLLPASPNQPDTLIYENDTSAGKRVQHCYNLQNANSPDLTDSLITLISQADIIVVATLLPNYSPAYLAELLGHAKPDTLKVLCPQGYFRHIAPDGLVQPRPFEEATQIVPLFDLVMYSEEDSPEAFKLAKELKQTTDTAVVVTQSAQGATIIGKETDQQIPTKPIAPQDIVDSVGCGDTFAAAVAFSYFQSHDLSAAILDGHHAAAKKLLTTPTKD
jgi:sugar/nucleoside kinase (ribokinase family)